MKKKKKIPSFNENFDFHTVLLPLGNTTATDTGIRFLINEEGQRVEFNSWCPPAQPKCKPLGQARPVLLPRENIFALNVICSNQ